jgi:hypothetical protein
MKDAGKFCGHFVYFTAICYVLRPLGIFWPVWYVIPVLVCSTNKNLAALALTRSCHGKS